MKLDGKLLPIDIRIKSDPKIDEMIKKFDDPLQEVICRAERDLDDSASRQLGAGKLVVDAVRHQTRADLAIVGGNSDTTGIAAGGIRLSDVVRLRQYHTPLMTARMKTDQIRTLLERQFYLTSGCTFTRQDTAITNLRIGGEMPSSDGTYLVALTKQVAFRSRKDLKNVSYDQTGQRVDTALEKYLRTVKVVR